MPKLANAFLMPHEWGQFDIETATIVDIVAFFGGDGDPSADSSRRILAMTHHWLDCRLLRHARFVFAVAYAWVLVPLTSAVAGQIDVVMQSGGTSPDGNGQFALFIAPALNDAGQLAFLAALSGTAGGTSDDVAAFRKDASQLTLIARKGVSTVDGSVILGFGPYIALDGGGAVSGLGQVTPSFQFRPFIGSGGPLTPLVTPGSPSPSGNNMLISASSPVLNDAGVAVFRGSYDGGNPENGIYARAADGTLTTRLLQGSQAPGGGTFSLLGTKLTLNESAQIGLRATVTAGGTDTEVALRIDGTTAVELARVGETDTSGIAEIESFLSNYTIVNDAGQVAFTARYRESTLLREGIFVAEDTGITLVAPGLLPNGGSLATGMRLSGFNSAGQVALFTGFTGGNDPLSGVYLADAAGPVLAALEDTATPEGTQYFRSFFPDSLSLNENGQLAFVAELSNTVNGASAGKGLFVYDPDAGLQQIARAGDMLAGGLITDLLYFGNGYTGTMALDTVTDGMNNDGEIAFSFVLADGRTGVAIWSNDVVGGDFNNDGTVDAADYVVWRKIDGTRAGYNTWRSHFGQTSGSGAGVSTNAAVPEPATTIFLVLATANIWLLGRHDELSVSRTR